MFDNYSDSELRDLQDDLMLEADEVYSLTPTQDWDEIPVFTASDLYWKVKYAPQNIGKSKKWDFDRKMLECTANALKISRNDKDADYSQEFLKDYFAVLGYMFFNRFGEEVAANPRSIESFIRGM